MTANRFRVGVDIGGTFTDIVLLDAAGRIHTKKVSSSVDDYARAIVDGLREGVRRDGLSGSDLVEVLHGTTVASNAILELKGARTGLITTRAFATCSRFAASACRSSLGWRSRCRSSSATCGSRCRRTRRDREAARPRRGGARARPSACREDRGAGRVPAELLRQSRARGAHRGDRPSPGARAHALGERRSPSRDPRVRADRQPRSSTRT